MAAFAKVMLVKREGILEGLAGGPLAGDQSSTTSAAAAAAATTAAVGGGVLGGAVGGVISGVDSVVNGVTSAVGGLTSAVGGILPSASVTASASSPTVSASSVPATTSASATTSTVATSTIFSSSSSSAQLSSPVLSSAPTTSSSIIPTSSPTSSPPATTSQVPLSSSIPAANDAAGTVTVTTHLEGAAATGSATPQPSPVGFLNNKPLMAGVFTVVGVIALILLFVGATWFIRRRRRDRFTREALDFSPEAHLTMPVNDDEGYPNSIHRTSSNGSQFSRRAPTTYGRESPDRLYPVGGYGTTAPTQGYGAAPGGGAYGYYNTPAPPLPSQAYMAQPQMQQAYGAPMTYQQQHPSALRPGAPAAQNPFETPSINRSRSPSPSQSSLAYAGYADMDQPDDRVQVGRKVSITKAFATIKGRPPALQLPETFGNSGSASLKVING